MSQRVAVIETERLILRRYEDADGGAFFEMNSDPEVMRYLGGVWPRQRSDDAMGLINGMIDAQGFGFWAAEAKQRGLVGFVGLNRPQYTTPSGPTIEIGWRLARAHWGKGYATEGARAAMRFAFNDLELPELVAFTSEGNARSVAVMARLGMKRRVAADFEHPHLAGDDPARHYHTYAISAADWTRADTQVRA